MDQLFAPAFDGEEIGAARLWLVEKALALSVATLAQALVVGLAFLAARVAAPRGRVLLARPARGRFEPQIVRLAQALQPLVLPIVWLLILWLMGLLASDAGLPLPLMNAGASL